MKTMKDLCELIDTFGEEMIVLISVYEGEWLIAASCYTDSTHEEDEPVLRLKGPGKDMDRMVEAAYYEILEYKERREK